MKMDLTDDELKKIERLKTKYNIKTDEEVIKRLIKQFPEQTDQFKTEQFDVAKETNMEGLI